MFYTKCINVLIDSIGPSIFFRSIGNSSIQNLLFSLACLRIFNKCSYIVEFIEQVLKKNEKRD